MKLGMTSLTLRDEEPSAVVEHALRAGLSGIEWGVSDKHVVLGDTKRAQMIADLCRDKGIEVFSLGSYCRMDTRDDLEEAVITASALGAPVIRIWAGGKSPLECTEEEIRCVVENTRYMADLAYRDGIVLGFEYHGGSLTETAHDAVALIEHIDRDNVGLYWQSDYTLASCENFDERNIVLPYCIGNMHIQNYSPDTGYGLLEEIKEEILKYYGDIKEKPYNLMIEFVKNSSAENLIRDAVALRSVLDL